MQVLPRVGERLVLPWPTLVWIELNDLEVTLAPAGDLPAVAQQPAWDPLQPSRRPS